MFIRISHVYGKDHLDEVLYTSASCVTHVTSHAMMSRVLHAMMSRVLHAMMSRVLHAMMSRVLHAMMSRVFRARYFHQQ